MLRTLLLVSLFVTGAALAQAPGTEDPTFTVAHPTGASEIWVALATQPDGKILAVGRDMLDRGKYSVHRFNSNGQPDTVFGSGGVVNINISTSTEVWGTDPFEILVDPLGRIYVAGTYHNRRVEPGRFPISEYGFALVRLLANGALDGSFASGGIFKQLITANSNNEPMLDPYPETAVERRFSSLEINDVALAPDGKVLLVGQVKEHSSPSSVSLLIVRLHTDGRFDTGFGANGLALTPLNEAYFGLMDAQVSEDGSLLVLGREVNPNEVGLKKLTAQGTLDTNFGTNGTLHVSDDASFTYGVFDMALQPDGRILVAGARRVAGPGPNGNGEPPDPMVFRVTAGGALDTSFGTGGFAVPVPTAAYEVANSIALEPGGKIVVAGTGGSLSDTRPFLIRLAANGAVDTVTTNIESVDSGTLDLAVGHSAYLLTDANAATLRKFFIDPVPRSGSLNTGQTPSVSGFRIEARNTNGTEVDTAQLPQALGLNGYIFAQSTDINAIADIFVVAATERGLYMRNTSGAFVPWNSQVSTLVPAYEDVQLATMTHVPIYAGQLPFAGTYYLYIGYMRSDGGPLIYIDEPATFEVTF